MDADFETPREKWLREEIAARLRDMRANPAIGIPAEQVFVELERHHRERLERNG